MVSLKITLISKKLDSISEYHILKSTLVAQLAEQWAGKVSLTYCFSIYISTCPII